ncbi:transposable element Tcb2 transposase [Trichonephila clavipes]|nr:transposable element Tcb2 transposase [Trichonephila clavipes]
MSTMSQRSHLTDSEAWGVFGRIWNRFLETGSAGRRPGQGRRRATTPNKDRYLVLTARRHRNMNATLLQQHLRSATGTTVSTQTVRNLLHGVDLYARRTMVCVRLTSRHRRDRRERTTEHVNWRRNEWSNVLFSDESRFSVHPNNRPIFIWRDSGNRNNHVFMHKSVRFGGGGVLVYGGISIDGRTDLYIIRDRLLTARLYRDEILRPIVFPYAAAIGDDFILMDDNCRPHRANLVEDFLFEEGIVRMKWPACSLDMNPIEHVIKRCYRGLGRGPRLTSKLRSPTGSLKIFQCNINGLSTPATRTKLEQLIDIAHRNGVQVVALQETKLSEHTNIKLKNFSIYRTDRPYGSGGGLAFLVLDVNYKKITSPSTDSDLEMQGISITWKRRVINIFNLYHPPNQDHHPAEIFDCSDKITIFLGDLNAKHQRRGCSTNNDLLNADDDEALIFLNSGLPTPTSFSYGTSEALDITLVSPELHPHCDWDKGSWAENSYS